MRTPLRSANAVALLHWPFEAAENNRKSHTAGDNSDDRILLQDVDEVLVSAEGRGRPDHKCDEQDEGDKHAVVAGKCGRFAPSAFRTRHQSVLAIAGAPVIMRTISSARVFAVSR